MSPLISILLAACLLTCSVTSATTAPPPAPTTTKLITTPNKSLPDTSKSDDTGFLPDSATSTMNTPTDILPEITTTTTITIATTTTSPTTTQPPTTTSTITQPTTTTTMTTTATTTPTTTPKPTTTATTTATATTTTTTTTKATTTPTTTTDGPVMVTDIPKIPTTLKPKPRIPNVGLDREIMLILTVLSDDEGENLNLILMQELFRQHKPTSAGLPPSSLWNPRMRKYYLSDQLAARLGGWPVSGALVSTVLRNLDDDGLSPSLLYSIKLAEDKASGPSSFNFNGWVSPWLWRMRDD